MSNARLNINEILFQRANTAHEKQKETMRQARLEAGRRTIDLLLNDPAFQQGGIDAVKTLLCMESDSDDKTLFMRTLMDQTRPVNLEPKALPDQLLSGKSPGDRQLQQVGQGTPEVRGNIVKTTYVRRDEDEPSLVNGGNTVRAPIDTVRLVSPEAEAYQAALNQIRMNKAGKKKEYAGQALETAKAEMDANPVIGELSALYESGDKGIEAIGYDVNGGTSYGKYQIASRPGTMDRFLEFLEKHEPEWEKRLRESGPANTSGKKGAMPDEWKTIARESPERFEELQDMFITDSHFKPAMQGILQETQINLGDHSLALKEVLWSTAVQHGARGAVRIFSKAMEGLEPMGDRAYDEKLIEAIYQERNNKFQSSTKRVQQAAKRRLSEEKTKALALLNSIKKIV